MRLADSHAAPRPQDRPTSAPLRIPVTDAVGFPIFSDGSMGRTHACVHQALDRGAADVAYRALGGWLRGRTGSGSRWVHLQWHALVLEVHAGAWDRALERYLEHVHPAAGPGGTALVDAPSALWRLALAAPHRAHELPWERARQGALEGIGRSRTVFERLHDLLAFAGANDRAPLLAWSWRRTPEDAVPSTFATAMLAWLDEDWTRAARQLRSVVSSSRGLGGSRAQHDLFEDLHRVALARSRGAGARAVPTPAPTPELRLA